MSNDKAVKDQEMLGNLPLQYVDGPDYCTVTDATGGAFALTVQPELMKLMEAAASAHRPVTWREEVARIIYDAFPFEPSIGCAQKPPWIPNGNSFRQDDARKVADAILALTPSSPGDQS